MAPKARANGEGSIFPYRTGYAAYVWVRTPLGDRKRKYVYGKTRDEVHDKWVELHREAKAGPVATSVPRLDAFLATWLGEVIKPNRAPLTYVNYELFVRRYIVPSLGDRRLDRLQVRDVQQWINKLPTICQCCAQGKDERRPVKARRCCARGLCCHDVPSARTISDIRACLRSALSHAVRQELVARNVAQFVTLPSVRRRKGKAWTTEEVRIFLESARTARDAMFAAYVLAVVLGLRKGEILGLTWADVDLDAGELTIGRQLQRASRELLHRETKTAASDDTLPLPDIVATALRHRRDVQRADRTKAADSWQDRAGFVFTTRLGLPIDPRNFNRSWDNRCARSKVRKITVHDARRSCATLLVDLDVHPRVIMRILRHAQFAVTMEIYSKASSTATRDALRKLGDSLGP